MLRATFPRLAHGALATAVNVNTTLNARCGNTTPYPVDWHAGTCKRAIPAAVHF